MIKPLVTIEPNDDFYRIMFTLSMSILVCSIKYKLKKE